MWEREKKTVKTQKAERITGIWLHFIGISNRLQKYFVLIYNTKGDLRIADVYGLNYLRFRGIEICHLNRIRKKTKQTWKFPKYGNEHCVPMGSIRCIYMWLALYFMTVRNGSSSTHGTITGESIKLPPNTSLFLSVNVCKLF